MNKYPIYIEVNGEKYEINTDFRVALECDAIARDEGIGEYEKILAIIYKLFGEKALDNKDYLEDFLKLAVKYLRCGKDDEELENNKEPSMDFEQDSGYIRASFMSDYNKDLGKEDMHWWEFNDLLQGLTENAVLNRVRYIREESLSGKKGKELEKWIEMKKQVALKRKKTEREEQLDKIWEEQMKKGD